MGKESSKSGAIIQIVNKTYHAATNPSIDKQHPPIGDSYILSSRRNADEK